MPDEEMIIIDYLHIFKKNGFNFIIDENAEPRKKIQLISIPFSKRTQFGIYGSQLIYVFNIFFYLDIYELITRLKEQPDENCYLSRVVSMFASRACRKSIMFGKILHEKEMKKVYFISYF